MVAFLSLPPKLPTTVSFSHPRQPPGTPLSCPCTLHYLPSHQTRRLRAGFHVANAPRTQGQLALGLRPRLLCEISRSLQTMPFRTWLPWPVRCWSQPGSLLCLAASPWPASAGPQEARALFFPADPFVCSLPSPQSPGPLPTRPLLPHRTASLLSMAAQAPPHPILRGPLVHWAVTHSSPPSPAGPQSPKFP